MVAKVKDGGGKIENKEYTKMNPHKIRQRMSGKLIFRMWTKLEAVQFCVGNNSTKALVKRGGKRHGQEGHMNSFSIIGWFSIRPTRIITAC